MRPPYTCIYREIWDDERFYSMSDTGKLVYFYVLTTPLGNGLGCFKAGKAAMAEESRMDDSIFNAGFNEGLNRGLFFYDEHYRVVLIPKYFQRNSPNTPNGIKAVAKDYIKIPRCPLKLKCFNIIEAWILRKGETENEDALKVFANFKKVFYDTFGDRPSIESGIESSIESRIQCGISQDRSSPSPSPSPSYSPTYSPTVLPNGNKEVTTPPETGVVPTTKTTVLDDHKKKKATKKLTKQLESTGITPAKPVNGTATWQAYSQAYEIRYGTAPVRNAKTNSLCKQLLQRLGADEAPKVAQYYPTTSTAYYVARGHSLECLVKDAEKIRTEWATGKQAEQPPNGQKFTAQEQSYWRSREIIDNFRAQAKKDGQ